MPYHVAAYFESIDNTANVDINALTDQVLSIRSNHFVFREQAMLRWAAAMSATLSRARISQPSINVTTRPYIRPIEQAVVPGDLFNFADYKDEPFKFQVNEELAIEATSAIAMGSENFTALVGLVTDNPPLPAGNIFTLRATDSTTVTANAWSTISDPTFDNQIPEGEYAIVGAEFQGATCQAGRILLPGTDTKWRPGAPGITSLANQSWPTFRKGGLGFEWGRFNAFAMPEFEFLCNAADTAQEIYIDIVKVR